MTRDDVIRMAREAGLRRFGPLNIDCELERFAALVAAREREECAREADHWYNTNKSHRCGDYIAAAIRARGTP